MTSNNVPKTSSNNSSLQENNSAVNPSQSLHQNPQQSALFRAQDSLRALMENKGLSSLGRARLQEDFAQLERYFQKLQHGHLHIAVLGRVSVGKSALLNALAGKALFQSSVLHGETKERHEALWQVRENQGVFLIDTPGIDEVDGQIRREIAERAVREADIVLFVLDGDMTQAEYQALCEIHRPSQALVVVVNKADRLNSKNVKQVLKHLRKRLKHKVDPNHIVAASAQPSPQLRIQKHADGRETEHWTQPAPDIEELQETLWEILEAYGHSHAALNASLFAGELSERLTQEMIKTRQHLADLTIKKYAMLKALGVALNPIPAVDLVALGVDASMVAHLSQVYGLPMTRHQAKDLLTTIATQTGLLLGTSYGIHILSSALKGLTGGLSTVLTASAQGAVAYYGSMVIGKAAEQYFIRGANWGEHGAKKVIADIVESLDKDTLMNEAKTYFKTYLKS